MARAPIVIRDPRVTMSLPYQSAKGSLNAWKSELRRKTVLGCRM